MMVNQEALKRDVRERLAAVYALADENTRARGLVWYQEANAFAQALADRLGLGLPSVCGVIAALSPSVAWEVNKWQTKALCEVYAAGGDLDTVPLSTYSRQCAKAKKILSDRLLTAGIEEALGMRAFKTRAFFENILRPDTSDRVTVDQHMIVAAGMEDSFTQSAVWCYALIVQIIRELSAFATIQPCQMQAILWLTWVGLSDWARPRDLTEDEIEALPF